MKKLLTIVVFCLPVFGQAKYSALGSSTGSALYGAPTGGTPAFYAALPINWVDNTICNPPGGVYDTTVILGTTNNIGPNVSGSGIGSPYALTPSGLEDAMNNWRDNADNASQTAHFADKWWLIEVPAQSTGLVLHGATFDSNNALISLPGKLNGSTEPTKCLVVDSTTPLSAGVMACGRGLPGFGGARNPGCSSPNDKANMWKVQLDAPLTTLGHMAVYSGSNLVTPTNWVNHIVLRDIEITEAPGAAPSAAGVHAPYLFRSPPNIMSAAPCSVATPCISATHISLDRYYVHGNDPGDSGQPTPATITNISGNGTDAIYIASNNFFAGEQILISGLTHTAFNCATACTIISTGLSSTQFEVANTASQASISDSGTAYDTSETANGACASWTNSGTVTVAPDSANPGTSLVTLTSTGAYFAMTFTVGSTININGFDQTIANTSYTQGVSTGAQNTQVSITGSLTLTGVSYIQSNPPSKYAIGCGDDVVWGIEFEGDWSWRQNGYIEKIHWWGSESHATEQGFSNGPYKDVNNWEEGGSAAWFNGGAPVDAHGGPESDQEVRRNYFGRDLNYRQLTGVAGSSPAPPWGCGSADSHSSHNTCPFNWAVKNSVELKLGHRVLFDGNIVENSWADGQTGWCIVVGPRSCSGGAACGIYDAVTGLPKTAIDNIRFSNNWVRNCPEPFTTGSRSGGIGDGGGTSLPSQNNDYINNLMTNINDTNQTGDPNDQWVWGLGSTTYPCAMSYIGSGPYTVTAACAPYQQDITSKITGIASASAASPVCTELGLTPPCSTITISYAERLDPTLCLGGSAATCIANGQTVVISGESGWNGTFAMNGTTGNWAADGTGGNNIVYVDATNDPGNVTLCANASACKALFAAGMGVTFASLGFKMTDISVGDAVYASNVGGGDTTCATNGYAVGGAGTSATYAISGTVTTGLTVVYQVAAQPSSPSATCVINNAAGFPKYVTFQNNTVLSPNAFALQADNGWQLSIDNQFFNNVFADNDSGLNSDINCTAAASEGSLSFECWDSNTLGFYQNVLTSRNSSNWSVVNCPGGSCVNAFPISVNCTGSSADPTCLGYVGFVGASPIVIYPSGACVYDGSNPANCPLMALPWADNFTYTDVSYVGSSSYPTQGVNTTQLNTAMTQEKYVCPTGANCGTHGPYPD